MLMACAQCSLLVRRRLSCVLVNVGLVGFVVPDGASCSGAELAMARHVSGDPANDGTLNAPLGVRRAEGHKRNCRGEDCGEDEFHKRSPDVGARDNSL